MAFKTDIEIAQETTMQPITEVAKTAGVDEKYLEQYGKYKAKVDYNILKEVQRPDGKLILVTAINPTPAGEGKTTTTVGLADGMRKLGKNVLVALREPSLGPVFGVKGGAAGGGYAQVVPMEDINLHFTGDFHAIGAANNLLAAMPQDYAEVLNLAATPVDFLNHSGSRVEATRIRNYLGSLRFTTLEMEHPISQLSGGQKAKIFFLHMILEESNVLLLDEPTRNFSPLSGPVIRELLSAFGGAILSVSHDRLYLEEVCQTIYALTPQGLERVWHK